MAKSTKPRAGEKRARFPLTLHKPTGQYRKRIRGKDFYFGTDADEALKRWLAVKDDLLAGRTPRPYEGDQITLRELCNHFLTNAKAKRDAGELSPRSFADYYATCELMLKHLGKTAVVEQIRPDDLMAFRRTLAKTRGPHSLGNEVNRTRVILGFGFRNGLTDKPLVFGDFKRPAKRVMRRQKAVNGPRLLEADTINTLLDAATVQLRAMILLGVNCGFGNADCGLLTVDRLDLQKGVVDYPRGKTGIERRCPLWPETVDALRAALDARRRDDDRLVFRTRQGNPWHVENDKPQSAISQAFRKLCDAAGCEGVGTFYDLRRTFETIAGDSRDQVAVDHIMGHVDDSMAGVYRQRIDDDRLRRVTDHVRTWLYGGAA